MVERRSVAISGWGTVSACGAGRESFARAVAEGRSCASQIERSDVYHRPSSARLAGLVAAESLSTRLKPAQARRMSRPSRIGLVAALEAVEHRGSDTPQDWEHAATFVGTSFGPCSFSESLLKQVFEEGPTAASPMLFTESVANAAAAQIALRLKARGPSLTVTQREASGVLAVGQAVQGIVEGASTAAIAGAVDEMSPLLHAVLDRFGALARARRGLDEAARPFDLERNGYVAAEGATMVCLDLEDVASRPLAKVLGTVAAFDPSAPPTGWGTGRGLATSLSRGLERLDVDPGSIDVIVAGASGARDGDRLEATVLEEVWGNELPPVVAPKSVTGDFGGSGLAAALLLCEGRRFGATPGFSTADPTLGLRPITRSIELTPHRVLLSAPAAGGAIAWLVLETYGT